MNTCRSFTRHLVWNENDASKVEYGLETTADEVRVHYEGPQRTHLGMLLQFQLPGDVMHNNWVTRFDPFRIAYGLEWKTKDGAKGRPLKLRPMIFFVPETENRTRLHVFVASTFTNPKFNVLLKLLAAPVTFFGSIEIRRDAAFLRDVPDIPKDLRGMALGRFDKPLVETQKRIDAIYFAGRRQHAEFEASRRRLPLAVEAIGGESGRL